MPCDTDYRPMFAALGLQEFWLLIFEDAAVFRQYHATANADPHADVGTWKDGRRTVSFCTPIQAPQIVKKTLGMPWAWNLHRDVPLPLP